MSNSQSVTPTKRGRSRASDIEEPPRKRQARIPTSNHPHAAGQFDALSIPAPKTIADMPPEIMGYIFDMLIPPPNFIRAKTYSNAPWTSDVWRGIMSTKRRIVRVCRTWYMLAIFYLYREIAITHMKTARLLRRTLTKTPQLGHRVRCISHLSPTDAGGLFDDDTLYPDLRRIFALCPKVVRMNLFPPPGQLLSDHLFPNLPQTLTALDISSYHAAAFPAVVATALQANCGHLRELRLPEEATTGALSFPHLHTLHLTLWHGTPLPLCKWSLPKLQRVTFSNQSRTSSVEPRATVQALIAKTASFLQRDAHGLQLTYLAFPAGTDPGPEPDSDDDDPDADLVPDYAPLLAACPAITHLVLPAYYRNTAPAPHAAIEWLDLLAARDGLELDDGVLRPEQWARLRGLRRLDVGLERIIVDVPVALSPQVREAQVLKWPGMEIVQSVRDDGSVDVREGGAADVAARKLIQANEERARRQISWDHGLIEHGPGTDDGESEGESDEHDVFGAGGGSPSADENSASANEDNASTDEHSASAEEDGQSADVNDSDEVSALVVYDGPRFQDGFRQVLQAALPERLFLRFERAVMNFMAGSDES
ncbi:hypothetical protein C8R43DRAFT_1122136 [Mycena crocata]|nr:hypothetical protein C8R43DRAFT_1122136 [Mycena crocata]